MSRLRRIPSQRMLYVSNYDLPSDLSEVTPETLDIIKASTPLLEEFYSFAAAKFDRIKEQFQQHEEEEDSKPLAKPAKRWAKAAKREARSSAASSLVELQPPLLAEVEENPREVVGYLMEEGSKFLPVQQQGSGSGDYHPLHVIGGGPNGGEVWKLWSKHPGLDFFSLDFSRSPSIPLVFS